MAGGRVAGGRITEDSWNLIATEIINIVEDHRDYGSDELTSNALKEYLEGEGIIEVFDDQE